MITSKSLFHLLVFGIKLEIIRKLIKLVPFSVCGMKKGNQNRGVVTFSECGMIKGNQNWINKKRLYAGVSNVKSFFADLQILTQPI